MSYTKMHNKYIARRLEKLKLIMIKEGDTNMYDEDKVQSVMEVIDDELIDLGALPYVETLSEIRNRIDEMINECIKTY